MHRIKIEEWMGLSLVLDMRCIPSLTQKLLHFDYAIPICETHSRGGDVSEHS